MLMANLKQISKEVAVVIYFIVVLICLAITFFGCSSTPNIIYRDTPVYIHTLAYADTLYLKDTIYTETEDTLWYSDVVDSLNKKIGSVEVYYKKKIARLKLDAKTDTVIYRDTIEIDTNANSTATVFVNSLNWWEAILWFGVMGILTGLIGYLRLKRGKIF